MIRNRATHFLYKRKMEPVAIYGHLYVYLGTIKSNILCPDTKLANSVLKSTLKELQSAVVSNSVLLIAIFKLMLVQLSKGDRVCTHKHTYTPCFYWLFDLH